MKRLRNLVIRKFGSLLKRIISFSEHRPYQSFVYNNKYVEGQIDTVSMYYSFGLPEDLEGKTWLDLGCNEGSICLMAAQHGAKVTGVESNQGTYRAAQQRAAAAGADIDFRKADVLDFVGDMGSYDIVSLLAMVRHVHSGLMRRGGHAVDRIGGRAHLVYDRIQTLRLGSSRGHAHEI